MNYRDNKTPCSDRDVAVVAEMPVPSDRLYQLAAMTVVLFLLATMMV